MKRYLLTAVFLAALAMGQPTRREIVNPAPNPSDDAKANSANVPDAYAIPAQFQRVLVLRFKYQTDLLAGLENMVKQNKIRNAVFLSAIGSVRNYQVHAVSNRTFPSKDMFTKDSSAPADILGMSGYVIDGRIHAHITLATPEKAFGGHLEPGTNVFTFAAVTVGILGDDVDLKRIDDKTYR